MVPKHFNRCMNMCWQPVPWLYCLGVHLSLDIWHLHPTRHTSAILESDWIASRKLFQPGSHVHCTVIHVYWYAAQLYCQYAAVQSCSKCIYGENSDILNYSDFSLLPENSSGPGTGSTALQYMCTDVLHHCTAIVLQLVAAGCIKTSENGAFCTIMSSHCIQKITMGLPLVVLHASTCVHMYCISVLQFGCIW